MPRLALLQGAYEARSIIANAQRCVNLYPERNPKDADAPLTHYLTPGLLRHIIPPTQGAGRCLYTATNGRLYYVCGQKVYYIDSNFVVTTLGTLIGSRTNVCYMVDNGNAVLLVDGSANGWAIRLSDNAFAQVNDPNFLGADRVDYTDTFFVLNQPGTKNFYSSESNVTFEQLTQAGGVLSGTLAGGAGYTNGTYVGTALTGGSGTGAVATIVVAGGAITSVTLTSPGVNYKQNDVLSAAGLGAGTGFAYTLSQLSDVTHAFDPTWIAGKTGFPDQIATICCVHREPWLFGIVKTTEIWYDAGGANFPFAIMPGVFVERGCAARYSVCKNDLSVFWLGLDQQGQGIVYMGAGYRAIQISTPAIEAEIATYATISDAVGLMYQQAGHTFYVLNFPSADVTWVFDVGERMWHERSWTDPDTGLQHRWRGQCCALAYGLVLAADWENGQLYQLDLSTYTDYGGPINRLRSFPHVVNDGKRLSYDRFVADMECGNGSVSEPTVAPTVLLSWSDTRGRTFGTPLEQSLGAQGEYFTQPQWRALGLARDRVFMLQWSGDCKTALNGAWIDVTPSDS